VLYALGYRTTPRFDPLLAFLGQKRPHDLINEARRHEFPNADIGRRAVLAFAEISAEEQIPNHHVLAVIPVRLAQILAWCQTPEMKYLVLDSLSEMSRFFTRTYRVYCRIRRSRKLFVHIPIIQSKNSGKCIAAAVSKGSRC
jgi:hypothetical protein